MRDSATNLRISLRRYSAYVHELIVPCVNPVRHPRRRRVLLRAEGNDASQDHGNGSANDGSEDARIAALEKLTRTRQTAQRTSGEQRSSKSTAVRPSMLSSNVSRPERRLLALPQPAQSH